MRCTLLQICLQARRRWVGPDLPLRPLHPGVENRQLCGSFKRHGSCSSFDVGCSAALGTLHPFRQICTSNTYTNVTLLRYVDVIEYDEQDHVESRSCSLGISPHLPRLRCEISYHPAIAFGYTAVAGSSRESRSAHGVGIDDLSSSSSVSSFHHHACRQRASGSIDGPRIAVIS